MGEIVNKSGIFSRPLSLLAVMTTESRVEWQVRGCRGAGHGPQAYCQSLGRVTRTSSLLAASACLIVPQDVPLNHHIYCYSYAGYPWFRCPQVHSVSWLFIKAVYSKAHFSFPRSQHFPEWLSLEGAPNLATVCPWLSLHSGIQRYSMEIWSTTQRTPKPPLLRGSGCLFSTISETFKSSECAHQH